MVCAAANHTGYAHLDPPIVHERHVRVSADGSVAIDDRFERPDGHRLRWHFLLHPDVHVTTGATTRLTWSGGAAALEAPADVRFDVVDSWYSPSYGVRIPTRALVAEADAPVEVSLTLRPDSSTVC